MAQQRNPFAALGYLIVCLAILLMAIQILRGVLWLAYCVATFILSAALLAAVGYAAYLLFRSVSRSGRD